MAFGTPKPDLIVKDLVDIYDGLRRGDIKIERWSRQSNVNTMGFEVLVDLHDLRPLKQRVVVTGDKAHQELLDMISAVVNDLSYPGQRCNTHLMAIDTNLTFTPPPISYDIGINVTDVKISPIPGPTEIRLHFHVMPDLQQAAKTIVKMSQAAQTVGAAMQALTATMPWNVNDIPLPHEKLHDMGIGVEPIVAYRDFYADYSENGDIILCSRNGMVWPPRKKLRAVCKRNGLDPFATHDAPHVNCQCGIYAFDNPDHSDMKAGAYIWGEVALWGDVLICESGYRAEFAYPKTIFVRTNGTKTIRWLTDEIEAQYGVPTFLVAKKDGQTLQHIIDTALAHLIEKGGENDND